MNLRFTLRTATLAVIAAFALAACAPSPEDSSVGGSSSPSESPRAASVVTPDSEVATPVSTPVVDPAMAPDQLQFTATTLDGQAFEGTSLYGQPTILWFWAPWCPTCQSEAPRVADALDELPDGVQAIGIPGQSDSAAMQAFVDKYGLGAMVQVVDTDGSLWANFAVSYQPATALIAADGTVTTIPGSGSKADFLAAAASIAP